MTDANPSQVTLLLEAWRSGDPSAFDRLLPLVYQELHALARRALRGERGGQTLQTTALIHEAYLRLAGGVIEVQDRGHFYAVAARAMRRILVDHARSRGRKKRGGGIRPVTLDEQLAGNDDQPEDLEALDEALTRLSALDERKARAVELHYFGGLSYDEVAGALEISPATVHRDLRLAKAWLYREMRHDPEDG